MPNFTACLIEDLLGLGLNVTGKLFDVVFEVPFGFVENLLDFVLAALDPIVGLVVAGAGDPRNLVSLRVGSKS